MNSLFSKSVLILSTSLLLGFYIRIYNLTQVPPALHGDEIGTGYNAYSLIKTGKDEYNKFFPLTFRNDFSPLIFYATLPWILIMGFSEFSTRLPTVFVGTLIILVLYTLIIKLYNNKKLALLVALFLIISSWQIRSSRIALEMIWSQFFQFLGVLCFQSNFQKKRLGLMLGYICFGLSVTAYQSAKITTPLIILSLLIIFSKRFNKNWKLHSLLFVFCIVAPNIIYFLIRPINEMRFAGISVFTGWKNTLPYSSSLNFVPRILSLISLILTNYIKHFDPYILFFNNSRLRYFQVENIGMFYSWQIIGIIIGLIYVLKNIKNKANQFILSLIIISPIPASLTTGVPFANIGRNLLMFPIFDIISAIGILIFFTIIRKVISKQFMVIILVILCYIIGSQFYKFLLQYYIEMPKQYALFWGQPLKEVMPLIILHESSVNNIIITDTIKQPYMYLLLYGSKEPIWFLEQTRIRHPVVGYSIIGKYEFRQIEWISDSNKKNTLLIGTTQEIPDNANILKEVKQENNKVLLRVAKT